MENIVVLGGGVSGISAAYHLKKYHPEYNVILIEKDNEIGKRIKVSGNGRCNFSNGNISSSKYKNGDKIVHILDEFLLREKEFYHEINLHYYFDEEKRYYPVTDSAKTVHFLLLNALRKLNVIIKENEYCSEIIPGKEIKVITNNDTYVCSYLVCALGGISMLYHKDKNNCLNNLNLKFTKLSPSLCPLILKEKINKNIVGKRAKANVRLYHKDKFVYEESGEVLFKKDGISGIVIFNISSMISRYHYLAKDCYLDIDFAMDYTKDDLLNQIKEFGLNISFKGLLNEDIANAFINENRDITSLKNKIYHIENLYDFKDSQVTSGGIDLDNINLNNLSLKEYSNIFISGELLDIDGVCGGFNIFFANASGYFIAKNLK